MKRVNFHLTDQQMQMLETIRTKTGLKVAEQIRRAVDEYLRDRGRNSVASTEEEEKDNRVRSY